MVDICGSAPPLETRKLGAMSTYAIISDNMLQIGDQFDRYQIQAQMAQGGMSDRASA